MKQIFGISFIVTLLLSTIAISCKKDNPATLPVVLTTELITVNDTTLVSGGNITSDGEESIICSGVCWSTCPNPTIENDKTTDEGDLGKFTSNITGLKPGVTYHIRAYATNAIGTAYGTDICYTTNATLPTITTTDVSNITTNTASSGGNITSDGGASITSRGVCWNIKPNPTINNCKTTDGKGSGSFTSNITSGLRPGITYYLRAYAINSVGVAYGNEISFTMYAVMDIDGNGYHSVTIGKQVWMLENLKVTHYNDGEAISRMVSGPEWYTSEIGAFCWYNNDCAKYKNIYGALYNWYAVNTKKLSPKGWHVPSDEDWATLINYLGGDEVCGGKLKQSGTNYWADPNTGATNASGFAALPGGYCVGDGSFQMGFSGHWWSSTGTYIPGGLSNASNKYLLYSFNYIQHGSSGAINGLSVRCVKD